MAFSKSLEEFIEAALADGVLTDKERAVLHKRAAQEGVDPDELDVVIEGRLAKMKRETDWLKPVPPANEKYGNVTKCPNCGSPVVPGSVKCSECGYVFTNVKAVSSITDLFNQLTKIESERNEYNEEEIFNQASSLIKAYPIPTAKADIIEFLTTASTYIKDGNRMSGSLIAWFVFSIVLIVVGLPLCLLGGAGVVPLGIAGYILYNKFYKQSYEKRMGQVWKAKMAQVVAKAHFSLSGEPEYEQIKAYMKKNSNKKLWIGLGAVAGVVVIALIGYMIVSHNNSKAVEPQAKAQYENLMLKLDELETPDEYNYKEVESQLLKITWTDIDGDKSDYKENYLKKKRALAGQISSVKIMDDDGEYRPYRYDAPDEIKYPDNYIEN